MQLYAGFTVLLMSLNLSSSQRTSKCVCLAGFTGENCNQTSANWKYTVKKNPFYGNNQPKPRYGQSFLYDKTSNDSIMFGGRGIDSHIYADTWLFSFANETFTEVATKNQQIGRYFHCSVLYKVSTQHVITE